jgi:hypothetical protein
MITLITGLPGNGKTLYLLWLVEHLRRETGREVYYSGIRNLNLPWIEFGEAGPKSEPHMTDASGWPALPDGSIIVIDEAQRLYRPRALTKDVPPYVAALETHRHHGHDLYLVTQHPTLIEANVRRLVESHRHMMRKFGSTWATIHEWKGVKENCDKSRLNSQESQFKYPKEVYGWYKSAEVHTVKFRMPGKIMVLLALPLILAAAVWFASTRLGNVAGPSPAQTAGGPTVTAVVSPASLADAQSAAMFRGMVPRIDGLPWTASKYDHLTQPVEAPYPVGCVLEGERGDSGWCFTRQGNRFFPPIAFVRDFVRRGIFIDFPHREAYTTGSPPTGQISGAAGLPGLPGGASPGVPARPMSSPPPAGAMVSPFGAMPKG